MQPSRAMATATQTADLVAALNDMRLKMIRLGLCSGTHDELAAIVADAIAGKMLPVVHITLAEIIDREDIEAIASAAVTALGYSANPALRMEPY